MASKLSEIKDEIRALLQADTTLRSIIGVDGDGNTPVYQTSDAVGREAKNFLVYEMRFGLDFVLSQEGRKDGELEITAEIMPGTTPPDDVLDEVEERLGALLFDARLDTTSYEVKRFTRETQSVAGIDTTGQGYKSRIWVYTVVLDDVPA